MNNYKKLTDKEIKNILAMEKDTFDGDRDKAVAAHVTSVGVVLRCAGVPVWLDKHELGQLKAQITNFEKKEKK